MTEFVKPKKSILKNQRGSALVETIPILVVFLVLLFYGMGFFGVVHTGILNSISARAYAFETFRNRANVTYFRDRGDDAGLLYVFNRVGNRIHAIDSERRPPGDNNQYASTRPISIGAMRAPASEMNRATQNDHNINIFGIRERNRQGGVEVNPAWVMVAYGLCLDANCGD